MYRHAISQRTQRRLLRESSQHRDILQFDFIDTYGNLTLKIIAGFQWVLRNCPNTRYIMKVDEDAYINTTNLITYIDSHIKSHADIFGYISYNDKPHREIDHQYYVSKEEYKPEIYPPFPHGPGYLLTLKATKALLRIATITPYFRLEDVYIGICALRLNLILHHSEQFRFWDPGLENMDLCYLKHRNMVLTHPIDRETLLQAWASSCDEEREWS